jgi:hypothetical protein
MRVVIFRSKVEGSEMPQFSFSPIEADRPRGVAGSGPEPWKTIEVPYGSRVLFSQSLGEALLILAGSERGLTAREAAEWDGA